jgi:polyhydroxyalkanoate synthesis regulator phasin
VLIAYPENQTPRVLRDLRAALDRLDSKVDGRFDGVDKRFDQVTARMDNIRQALNGESVLGRYAAAEVEKRLEAIEKRLADLEETR